MASNSTARKTKSQDEKTDELIEAVAPRVTRRPQRVKGAPDTAFENFDKTYIQKPLSFFAKIEFARLVSKALDDALKTGDAGSINLGDLMGVKKAEDLKNPQAIASAFFSIIQAVPDLLMEVYMIALNVPAHERTIVAAIFQDSYDEDTESGLSDEDGLAILNTFVDQNVKVMRDFWFEKVPQSLRMAQSNVDPNPTQE